MFGRLVCMAGLVAVASTFSTAALVTFDFQDGTKNAAVSDPHISAAISSMGGSASNNALIDDGVQTGAGNRFQAFHGVWRTYQGAHYIKVDAVIAPGYKLNLRSFGYDMFAGSTTTGGWSSAAFSSATGNVWPGVAVAHDTTSGYGASPTPVFADLSGGAFQNLTGTVSFLVSPFQTHTNNIWSSWQGVDNIVIDGTVSVVPEPAALGLLAASSLMALRRRRR